MLGDAIAAVKATLKTIVGDDALLGADAGAQELALTSRPAVWKTRSSLQEHFAARRRRQRFQVMTTPSSENSLLPSIQMCSCLTIVNLIGNLSSASSGAFL